METFKMLYVGIISLLTEKNFQHLSHLEGKIEYKTNIEPLKLNSEALLND